MKKSTFKESVNIIYLDNSLNRSLKLIRLGIKKLENVKSINHEDYYFVFLYLSIGFEFLMKILKAIINSIGNARENSIVISIK